MIDSKQTAIVKKDVQAIIANKRYFYMLLLMPLLFSVVLPSIFVLSTLLAPESSRDFEQMVALLPAELRSGDVAISIIQLIFSSILPLFFLMIPIMTSSVMAASSFVGEKEKNTLETLFYSPLSVKQIFQAKVYSSLLVSLVITGVSFLIMLTAVQLEVFLLKGTLLSVELTWLLVLLLLVPAITLISITLIVRGSARAQTMEEAQQKSVFLILPLIVFMVGQFTGLFLVNIWFLLLGGLILGTIAVAMLQGSMRNFTYEMLLK